MIEPRYSETDQMGIIYHANYITWFEISRTRLMERLDFKIADVEARGFLFPVRKVSAQYHKPAVFGRPVEVSCAIVKYTGVRICYEYEVKDQATGELLVSGTSESAITDRDMKIANLAKSFPEFHEAIRTYYQECLRYMNPKE